MGLMVEFPPRFFCGKRFTEKIITGNDFLAVWGRAGIAGGFALFPAII